ncbi:5-methyltetrahydrofolate--homocysteine methyltransferase [Caldalkalibacillus uzonensis]|uniref:Methionine synthase n=1 Tax=Caldalkalibacillus uzonensis TaxID=353224 RepID=A0ABU0CVV5_9BACI|nr:methionine synthase [Caldalkalibacillus uzonensis]MDQ0339979.1 5-methyltetrahydrofolate--homocysteine methyltransferase [Caldalkalibacillus uzonensis]
MASTLFEQQLKKKILIIDGAMGTMLQQADLSAADFGGEEYEGCNEYLNLTAPHIVEWIHRSYLEAGADIIETNTFGGTALVLNEYNLGHRALEINRTAAEIARKVADEYATPEWPRFVAGSMGPTTKSLSVTGGTTFEELIVHYAEQAKGLLLGGVDLLLLETSQDMRNVKAGYIGICQAFKELGREVPLLVSGTIEPMGTTLAGQNIEAFYLSLEHMQPAAVGLNCATGPEFMTDHLRSLSQLATTAVFCYPNAGLPDEEGNYHESPQSLAQKIAAFAAKGWLNITGGCCGTTPEHIKAIAEAVKPYAPREIPGDHPHAVSGIEPLIYEESMRPLLVGERTNVIGSRKFKRLIADGKYEEAAEIARGQVKGGAHVIDICLADPDRDEQADMEQFLKHVVNKVKVPLMIDSTDEKVIEKALTYCQGKAIINSINLEDGEERFKKVVPLIKRFGAAVVVGTIDEQGMAVKAEDKLRIAQRSYDLLVNKYALNPRDIIFDPLVFPVGTGDKQYIGSAKATIDGLRMIKAALPECLTILGISNVSFGLPPVGREVLNAVFLYHCTQDGLDYAIVNTEKLERFASIPEEEVKLAETLIFDMTDEALAHFTAHFRGMKAKEKKPTTNMSLEERLANYVVEGTKEGLYPDLDQALAKFPTPLDIINGPLMEGMTEVGRLFNDNQLIVAEVLQSAEVMKAAVAYLEPHMEKTDDSGKGKVILATVKGDVHDIGKNLVDIILSNNGYKVIDLGINVAPNTLIEVVRQEQPDVIGLSGLLVKSAQQMVLTAQDLRAANIAVPILVGGAALSRQFTDNKIAPEYEGLVLYAKDAMDGLSLANRLQSNQEREKIMIEKQEKQTRRATREEHTAGQQTQTATVVKVRSTVSTDVPVFVPSDLERHVLRDYSIAHIQPYINMQMLLGHHLGLKGKVARLLEEGDERAVELKELVDSLLTEAKANGLISAHGVYQFFPAQSEGDDVLIYDPADRQTVLERFHFPRQAKAPYLCLADYLKPVDSGEVDYVGFFAVTAGKGIREQALKLKEKGDYLRSHALQALALELAEGFAERMHQVIRDKWGFPDPPDFTMQDRFSAKYQGQRYSFGYPACPNLEDQAKLFRLIRPEEIGITLTEGFMMEPEASVTAIVFAHPEARYFNVL